MEITRRRAARAGSVLAALALTVMGVRARADVTADLSTAPRVRLEELKKDYDEGRVLVIDVRAPESYRTGHIPGAINVPLTSLTDRLPELKAAKKPIVAYCA